MDFSACSNDNISGPSVHGCRGDFDFTLRFEKIFLSTIPCAVFIALGAPRLVFLLRKARIVDGTWFQFIKLAAIVIYAVFRLALLVLGIAKSSTHNSLFISSSVLEFAAATCMAVLSFIEHARSPRPSDLLNTFLFLTLLFDVTQTRSIWLSAHSRDAGVYTKLFTASTACKAALVLLESIRKQQWIRWDPKAHSPEETSGIYQLSTLFWLNPLLFLGYKKILAVPDLYPLDQSITIESLESASLDLNPSRFKGKKNGLARALAGSLAVPFLLPLAPRIALIGFSICQPLLIESLLSYLHQSTDAPANTGYGLIGATIIIYLGLPVSTALYEYYVQRALFKSRACLASVIYQKTAQAQAASESNADALTLMSTDIERIQVGLRDFNELWAIPLQGLISSYLLYQQLGAAFAAPIILIAVCTGASAIGMLKVGSRQKAWMNIIQKRVGTTANVIGNMKNIKLSGLTKPIERAVQDLRVNELMVGNKFRAVMLIFATIGYMPMLLSPLLTFAVTSRDLDATTIFTSVAYLYLLTEPLMLLFQDAPAVLAAFACLQRIQYFLEQDSRQDFRRWPEARESSLLREVESKVGGASPITIADGTFGWAEDKIVLRNINVTIASSFTIIIGPVASGKSTLCRVLLGEIPFAQGEVIMGSRCARIGFCDQAPFLLHGSIRENIMGFAAMDEVRYAEVIEATMLSQDLSLLPQGDHTNIGSSGVALSGGQKQRLSIARALYQQCDMFIFDDILSGLDAETEKHVFTRIFGPQGILKKRHTTAVLCTHAVHHLQWADHIIALSATGTVAQQGTFAQIVADQQYVHSLEVDIGSQSSESDAVKSPVKTQDSNTAAPHEVADSASEGLMADPSRALGDSAVFVHYFKRVGLVWTTIFLLLGVLLGFLYNFSTIWLQYWSADASSTNPKKSTAFYIGIYALTQGLALATLSGVFGIGMLTITKLSGSKLHESTIQTVTAAPLHFFTTTDTGVVTNLFSQDMTLIDNELPIGLINTNVLSWMAVGAAVVAATSSPYVLIAYPPIVALVYAVQKFYLRTSRQLRLLDLEMKSPLYTNFIDTIHGVVTIRAFGWVEAARAKNSMLLNTSQRPAYLLRMLQRWLTFVLGMVVALLALLVVTLSTQLRTATGFTGASMISIMTFGKYLASLVHSFTLLETSMGAVNRLKTFSETTPSEDLPGEDIVPPPSWPEKGRIEMRDVSASFGQPRLRMSSNATPTNMEENCTLQNLTMTIESGQKVAICGRTGSGKSSTILLLLRMLEPVSFSNYDLSIDGLSLDAVDRTTLRERLIVVPQEPVFLPDGTSFKVNLDPGGTVPDSECQAALDAVGLWNLILSRGGLAAGLAAESLSHGHKQLFSLAKAILRGRVRSKVAVTGTSEPSIESQPTSPSQAQSAISPEKQPVTRGSGLLILDEFNSSLDIETDKIMHDIIQREFAGYTILMVSHRLESIMDFDRVVVLDKGRLVEHGNPKDLVMKRGSRFRDLWRARQ